MVYLMVAPFPVGLADYQTALENLMLERVMLDVVLEQLVRVRPILDLNIHFNSKSFCILILSPATPDLTKK